MAYANYRYKGQHFIGEVHGERLIPLAGLTDVGPETSADLLASAVRLTEARVSVSEVALRPASPRAGKVICVGLNYKDHADDASTAAFPVLFPKYTSTLIATISEFATLEPGDVILTGTPSGVGYRRDPQLFLKDGDTITVTVEGIGSITNTVRAEAA